MRRQVRLVRPSSITVLSTRTFNCLREAGLPVNATRRDVALVFPALWLAAYSGNEMGQPYWRGKNFGRKSLAEVLAWLAEKPGERRA
jgi:hypothetical protein